MKVYGIQFNSAWENKDENFKTINLMLNSMVIKKDSLLVLPEMFATGFSYNIEITTNNEPRKTESFLSQLARDNHSWVLAGMVYPTEKKNKGINSSVIFNPDGEKIGSCSKLKTISVLGENRVHINGDKIEIYSIQSFRLTPFICYDLRFPEFFRSSFSRGTNLFVVIACWPKIRMKHWINLIQARAIENQSYVIGVNRVGSDHELDYCGHSLIVDPIGNILVEGGSKNEIIEADLDKKIIDAWRHEFPFYKEIKDGVHYP